MLDYLDPEPIMPSDWIVVRTHCVRTIAVGDYEYKTVKDSNHTEKLRQGKNQIKHGWSFYLADFRRHHT